MQIIQMLLIGITAGVMAGLFGIGGGIVLVPILVLLMKFPQQTANGTSLVALLLPVGLFGVIEYYKAGKIGPTHIRFGLLIAVGMFLGTYIGSLVAVGLSPTFLRRGFAGFMGAVAIKMWLS
jgi:uncharacterized membrane protein YfcA